MDNIKVYVSEIGCEDCRWIKLAQERVLCCMPLLRHSSVLSPDAYKSVSRAEGWKVSFHGDMLESIFITLREMTYCPLVPRAVDPDTN
jgi:hypothetical protein